MGPCVVVTDHLGHAVAPAILYGIDSRNAPMNAELTAWLGAEQLVEKSGNSLSSQSAGSKLAWLREERLEAWGRARQCHSLASFLIERMTGEFVMDHHTASQFDPLYDLTAGDWWEDGVAAVTQGAPIALPRLAWANEIVGRTRPLGIRLPTGIPVTAGTIDAWAEAVSVGADRPGQMMLMYGSTMFMAANPSGPTRRDGLWATRGVRKDSFSLAGGTATAGALTEWWSDVFSEKDFAQLHHEASVSPPGSRGLLTLPYFAGERTPFFDPDARGVVIGLTSQHQRGDLYRSALEGIAMAVRHNLELFDLEHLGITRGSAVGGGVTGGLWPQIVADGSGLTQVVRKHSIGASLGNAMLVAEALGERSDIESWNPITREYLPDPTRTSLYDELYHHYLSLGDVARPTMHYLANLQKETDVQPHG